MKQDLETNKILGATVNWHYSSVELEMLQL